MANNLMKRRPLLTTIMTRNNNDGYQPERIYELAERDAFRDKMRAGLCKQAMDNTALLATVEERLNSIAPTAKNEYRMIVESYAKAAMLTIIGGEW